MHLKKSLVVSLSLLTLAFASHNAFADDLNNWQIGIRALDVVPDASSSPITSINGNVTHISSAVVPELDINYYFTNHVSSELILATTRNSVEATGTSVGTVNLGSVHLLPPTLTLLYHFLPNDRINPYLGAGLNYTHFYNASSGPTASSIYYSDSFGPALQAGFDVNINSNWAVNFDVKKVFISSNVTASVPGVGNVTTSVKIDPFIYGVGMQYRF